MSYWTCWHIALPSNQHGEIRNGVPTWQPRDMSVDILDVIFDIWLLPGHLKQINNVNAIHLKRFWHGQWSTSLHNLFLKFVVPLLTANIYIYVPRRCIYLYFINVFLCFLDMCGAKVFQSRYWSLTYPHSKTTLLTTQEYVGLSLSNR